MGSSASSLPNQLDQEQVLDIVRDYVEGVQDLNGKIPKEELLRMLSRLEGPVQKSSDSISMRDIRKIFRDNGLLGDDERIADVIKDMRDRESSYSRAEFDEICKKNSLIHRALSKKLVVPDFPKLCHGLTEIFMTTKTDMSGQNADYIPQLSEKFVNPNQYGVSVCTIDGQRFNIGDTDARFCVQSCSKAITYCIAQSLHGAEKVHTHIGKEPSGRPFNEICLDFRAHEEDVEQHASGHLNAAAVRPAVPHNPMINAGAIMACSMVKEQEALSDRFDYIMRVWQDMAGVTKNTPAGRRPTFANSTYLSEAATADRNFCLAYLMQEENAFPDKTNLHDTLHLYFMCCSIECSSAMMSVVAATLANGGVCPQTGVRVFTPEVVRNTLSLMNSCGMYDYSGQFAFSMGFPAKSGVGGAVMVVIPGLMGICTFSPRLDTNGNSVRGVNFCRELAKRYKFHSYDWTTHATEKEDPRFNRHTTKNEDQNLESLLWAASEGKLSRARQLLARGTPISGSDYDGRTALHLAASAGDVDMIKYLLNAGANFEARDRYKNTPLDDAKRTRSPLAAAVLKEASKAPPRSASVAETEMWLALRTSKQDHLTKQDIVDAVAITGLRVTDVRLASVFAELPDTVSPSDLEAAVRSSDLLKRAVTGNLHVMDWDITSDITAIYKELASEKRGKVATYIPELAKASPDSWGVALTTVDGQRFEIGETKTKFCVQSCSKAVTYCIAHEENGPGKMSQHIGNEPSGRPFNEMILDGRFSPAKPHNPLINAGAIMSCSLVQPSLGDSEERISYVLDKYWSRLSGGQPCHFDSATYSSESSTADRNRCLAYMMSEANGFPSEIKTGKDLMENLEFYFKCCSIMRDAESMSVVAATLANGGTCPLTDEQIFKPSTVRDCLSLMYSCGMYDYSGQFAFHIGFPSKSGVAGALLIVIPNVMGICTWSPPLDANGNSVRGINFCQALAEKYSFHTFDRLPGLISKRDPTFYKGSPIESELGQLIGAATNGDIRAVELFHSIHGPELMNRGDYDGRTAIHLAAAEGRLDVITFFISDPSLDLEPVDTWKRTPLIEAKECGHDEAFHLLEDAIADRRMSHLTK